MRCALVVVGAVALVSPRATRSVRRRAALRAHHVETDVAIVGAGPAGCVPRVRLKDA